MVEPVCLCVHTPVSVPHRLRPCVSLGVSGSPMQWSPESGVLKHPPERAWGGMHAGPQTGACGKIRLVHVGVNPKSVLRCVCL